MAATSIEWTDDRWNPVTGCTKISAGCAHCYAETIAKRFWKDRKFTDVQVHADRLREPFTWKKPRRVFVNSMSDLFHEDVPDAFLDQVFAVMAMTPAHTYQVLTKRPERMHDYVNGTVNRELKCDIAPKHWKMVPFDWPLFNVWLGVSIEDQAAADKRLPYLSSTYAALRFASFEPLLGPLLLDHTKIVDGVVRNWLGGGTEEHGGLEWGIVGGESGHGARPMDIAWARGIVNVFKAAGVPVFVKQLGANVEQCDILDPLKGFPSPVGRGERINRKPYPTARVFLKDGKGADPAEWPKDLQVREFPAPRKEVVA